MIEPATPISRAPCRWVWWAYVAGLTVLFGGDLVAWARFGLGSSLHSYVLLIPFVSLYLLHEQKTSRAPIYTTPRARAVLAVGAALFFLLAFAGAARTDFDGSLDRSRLFMAIALFAVGLFIRWGAQGLRLRAFPVLFLFLMLPLTPALEQAFSALLQWASGWTAYALIRATGTPILKDGPFLSLPGLELEVAEACSGIRSTLVLLVTSIVVGQQFLRGRGARLLFTAVVIPIGILRNSLRILVIAWLTVHVDPDVIRGPLHVHGGPLFFALSLVLLFGVLASLRWRERPELRD
jgi:exosortase